MTNARPRLSFAPEALEPRVLLAVDPVTTDHPVWFARPGEAVVDGNLNDQAWASAYTVRRSAAFKDNQYADVKFLFGQNGLYVGWDIRDEFIFADGIGNAGVTFAWMVEEDDSMTVYFDPDNSRDELFADADRALAINLGSQADYLAQSGGTVRIAPSNRPLPTAKWVKGNAANPASPVFAESNGLFPTGLTYATVINGTINSGSVRDANPANRDVGWTTEMFFPWAAIGLPARPANGAVIGMNFDIIFDDDGGTRSAVNNGASKDRFVLPGIVDDNILGAHSSYHATLAGLRGPVNYAELVFVDPAVGTVPPAIAAVTSANTTGYGTQLRFLAPGSNGTAGHVAGYEIRYSNTPINSEAAWLAATKFENSYTPRLRGQQENLRIVGLSPSTTYHFAVRSIDGAGNLGALGSATTTVTTQSTTQDVSGGRRVFPSPMGRTYVTENGQPFVPVGDHLGLPWNFTRSLYPGDVWDPINNQYVNFSTTTPYEGPADPYFDTLRDRGINLMRVYLELQNYNYEQGQMDISRGTYWLEYPRGVFNNNMRGFMLNVLREATERNMYILFSPFDTFSFDDSFNTEFPWSLTNGGSLRNINEFFQRDANNDGESDTLAYSKARMTQLVNWINQPEFAPYRHSIFGWEPMSEWESNWTQNAEGDFKPSQNLLYQDAGRETEYRRRTIWMDDLGEHIKSLAPNTMLLNSTISRDPRGPINRQVHLSRVYDSLTPHLYTVSNLEPVNSPDTDLTVRPAVENAQLTAFWVNYTHDRRPIINGEWGNSRADWLASLLPDGTVVSKGLPSYNVDTRYTMRTDEAITRTMMWSGLASGQAGMGLRIANTELNIDLGGNQNQGLILTDTMRRLQRTFADFVRGTSLSIDFGRFNADPLAGRLTAASAAGKRLLAWGTADDTQGVAYVLHDTRRTTGSVTDGTVTITGLRPDSVFDVEFWSTAVGTTTPIRSVSAFSPRGSIELTLPTFTEDVAIKFKARPGTGTTQQIVSVNFNTLLVTFALDLGGQPIASIVNTATGGAPTTNDVAGVSGFTGRVVDMTPFVWNGQVHLAATDTNHQLWLFSGNPTTGVWTTQNLTARIGAPGITNDLTHYLPSWQAIHITGLDARGHAVAYWIAPSQAEWNFVDLTETFNGQTMAGGLSGFVTGWDALNVAGLNANGEVIVYWWAPGLTAWQTLNMTTDFSGQRLTGQLDAFVTPWGALNIAGLTAQGDVYTYWWAPGLSAWQLANLTQITATPPMAAGIEVAVGTAGDMSIFGLDATNNLRMVRWTPTGDQTWRGSDVRARSNGPIVTTPLGSSSTGNSLLLGARASSATSRNLFLFTYSISGDTWVATDTGLPIGG